MDEWTVRANDAMTITLVTKAEQGPPKTIASFKPTWTYSILENEDETIYGYKGLKINLRYNASDMRPHLSHTSFKRVPDAVATQESPEINDIFELYLPPGKLFVHFASLIFKLTLCSCFRQKGRFRARSAEQSR